jgi:type IV pilus assembly protein PilW
MRRSMKRQLGMSLMELMVASAIGLIGVTIITQVYLVNENVKRSTIGQGGTQVNGTLALYNMERDLRMAGMGVSHSGALGCNTINYYYNTVYSQPPTASALPTMYMAPITIITSAGVPDSFNVLYGASQDRPMPGSLLQATVNFNDDLFVDNRFGFATNDFIVLAQGTRCTLGRITADPAATADRLRHTGGDYNSPDNTFANYTNSAFIFNLGSGPVSRTYAIAGNALTVRNVLPAGGAAETLIDGIVNMRAQYGKDDGGGGGVVNDGQVDTWDATTPTTAAGWQQVLAVRIAVLARSDHYEKPDSGTCDASSATLAWSGGTFTVATADRCYKHRVFETVVPLRNMIWRTQ